jgi:hypothetical protein
MKNLNQIVRLLLFVGLFVSMLYEDYKKSILLALLIIINILFTIKNNSK